MHADSSPCSSPVDVSWYLVEDFRWLYCIYPKYLDTSIPYHTCSKIWTSTIYYPKLCLKIAGWVANSVDSDEMLHSAASHLSLYCLLRPACPNTYDKYGTHFQGKQFCQLPPSALAVLCFLCFCHVYLFKIFSQWLCMGYAEEVCREFHSIVFWDILANYSCWFIKFNYLRQRVLRCFFFIFF